MGIGQIPPGNDFMKWNRVIAACTHPVEFAAFTRPAFQGPGKRYSKEDVSVQIWFRALPAASTKRAHTGTFVNASRSAVDWPLNAIVRNVRFGYKPDYCTAGRRFAADHHAP